MAAAFIPEQGTKYAPCEPDCRTPSQYNPRPLPAGSNLTEHTDCAAIRRAVEGACRLCGKTLGWGARVYSDPLPTEAARTDLVHADCLEDHMPGPKVGEA